MSRYRRTFKVFSGQKLSDYLTQNTDSIQSLIEGKPEDYILNVNETEYINHLVNEFTVESVNIDFEGVFIDDLYNKDIPAEHFPKYLYGGVKPGESYPKPATIYHLPYSGNEDLLEYVPSSQLSWGMEVFLNEQCLCFEVVSLSGNPEEMKNEKGSREGYM